MRLCRREGINRSSTEGATSHKRSGILKESTALQNAVWRAIASAMHRRSKQSASLVANLSGIKDRGSGNRGCMVASMLSIPTADHALGESIMMSLEDIYPVRVLIFGASYGSLFATKLAMAGFDAQLVCLPDEARLINQAGTLVRMPVKGRTGLVEVRSQQLLGRVASEVPSQVDLEDVDLVVLAMQEPQYQATEVRNLLKQVAMKRLPTISIMNMPPLPYLSRIPGLNTANLAACYTDPSVWDGFDPELITLCSPDPQAFRPAEEGLNVLQVRLPTNFKAAAFSADAPNRLLNQIAAGINHARWPLNGQWVELPVKLKVHDSLFVPLAKWSMLIAGNYRCITSAGIRPIKEALHADLALSRRIYDWVGELCQSLGADPDDLVPFDKYAHAAFSLASPSSVARALSGGATQIERVDLLVQAIAKSQGKQLPELDEVVQLINRQLEANRSRQQQAKAA
jgi:ketopantoate reductase